MYTTQKKYGAHICTLWNNKKFRIRILNLSIWSSLLKFMKLIAHVAFKICLDLYSAWFTCRSIHKILVKSLTGSFELSLLIYTTVIQFCYLLSYFTNYHNDFLLDSPNDIAYVFSGYAPLSIRLVQHAIRSGW
jgi:hypothetical protein